MLVQSSLDLSSRAVFPNDMPTDICNIIDDYLDNGPVFRAMRKFMTDNVRNYYSYVSPEDAEFINNIMNQLKVHIEPTPEDYMKNFWAHLYIAYSRGCTKFEDIIETNKSLVPCKYYKLYNFYLLKDINVFEANKVKVENAESFRIVLSSRLFYKEYQLALAKKYPFIIDLFPSKELLITQLKLLNLETQSQEITNINKNVYYLLITCHQLMVSHLCVNYTHVYYP